MKKEFLLKKNNDFDRIMQNSKPITTKNFIFYIEKTNQPKYYFGFVVGKKKCNAVERNFIKRRMKNIVAKNEYIGGFNCVILGKKTAANEKFSILETEINKFLKKQGLKKEE